MPDDHHHEVRWTQSDLRRQLEIVSDAAREAGKRPVIEVLVQEVRVTSDRAAAVDELAARIPGAEAQEIARTPFLLIGSHEEMARQLLAQSEELSSSLSPTLRPRTRAL